GDAVIKADTFRASTGATGSGVTVGVISDSVNQVDSNGDGITGIAESQATGDLPAGVNVLSDGPAGSTDEGLARLAIVHDVAPGAGLAFHSANDPQDFANGITGLAAAGAKVVVDDIGFFDSPFFNDGVVAQAADQVTGNGVFYASAAGNDGNTAFVDRWRS